LNSKQEEGVWVEWQAAHGLHQWQAAHGLHQWQAAHGLHQWQAAEIRNVLMGGVLSINRCMRPPAPPTCCKVRCSEAI
jgi:hypothetical protein